MIPYIEIPPLEIPLPFGWDPLELHPFGALVLIGIIIGSRVTLKCAKERGISEEIMHSAIFWLLVAGFIGAHLVHVVFYYPHLLLENPFSILMVWAGISSFGGFAGAAIGLYLFTWRYQLPFGRFADCVGLGLLPGWVFGRLGCSIAHDHPGRHTDFFLAVQYPDGPRHDLGLYEVPFTIAMVILFHFIRKRPRPDGNIALLIGVIYAPYRFLLDFLRVQDATYIGLTPAQFGCIAAFIGGMVGIWWPRKSEVVGETDLHSSPTEAASGDSPGQ